MSWGRGPGSLRSDVLAGIGSTAPSSEGAVEGDRAAGKIGPLGIW